MANQLTNLDGIDEHLCSYSMLVSTSFGDFEPISFQAIDEAYERIHGKPEGSEILTAITLAISDPTTTQFSLNYFADELDKKDTWQVNWHRRLVSKTVWWGKTARLALVAAGLIPAKQVIE